MERETGVEPATSSLGSWHSTTELLPPALFSITSKTAFALHTKHTLFYYQRLLQLIHNHLAARHRRLRVHIQIYVNRMADLIGEQLRIRLQLFHQRRMGPSHDLKICPLETDILERRSHDPPPPVVFRERCHAF